MANLTRAIAIGETFVRTYFRTLLESPHLTHRYYREGCVLTRPDANGDMRLVASTHAINDLILSLNFRSYDAQIVSTDVQMSLNGCLLVLVTGELIRKEDHLKKKFVQSFFLAPQIRGYYVCNDVFRYMHEDESLVLGTDDGTVDSSIADNISSEPDPTLVSQNTMENPDHGLEVDTHVENEEESVASAEVVEGADANSRQEVDLSITDMATFDAIEDGPKKSYAADANVNTEKQQVGSVEAAPGSEASACISENASAGVDSRDEVQHHFIYIHKLPMEVSVSEVKEGLEKFGSIKPGGVQVKTSTFRSCCYSFVEFEELSSMTSALEAQHVTIAGRQAVIEPYNYQPRAVRGRGRFTPPNWNGARNENSGGGRGSGRSQFSSRGRFHGRGRGSYGRSGEGYQQVNQSGSGGGAYQSGRKPER